MRYIAAVQHLLLDLRGLPIPWWNPEDALILRYIPQNNSQPNLHSMDMVV